MAASANDYFMKLGSSSALVNSPKVTSVRSSGGATLAVDNCNWDTTTGKVFATYQVDTSNRVVAGTEIIWKGIVTGTTAIGSMTRLAGASDTGSSIGDIVELLPASAWANNLMTGILTEHNQDGTHKISQLLDTNGNEYIKFGSNSSAVNEITVTNAATGNNPSLTASGGDSNAGINLVSKGTGEIQVNGVSMSGAWTTWAPTWTNFTTGNGTLNYAKYKQVGKTVYFRLKFTHGSSSVVGTIPGFSVPVTMHSDYVANDPVDATVELNDATGFRNPAIALVGTTSRIDLYWVNTSITIQSITGTSPFTWTTSDQFMISGSYEAA